MLMRISLTICNVSAYVQIRKLVVLVSLKSNTLTKFVKAQIVHKLMMQITFKIMITFKDPILILYRVHQRNFVNYCEINIYLIRESLYKNSNKEIEEDIVPKCHQSHKV